MDLFIQLTLTGLTNGAILALAALGFVLIYKSSDVINFVQGEFLLVGAYVIFAMVAQFGLHWTLGMTLTIFVAIGLGVLVERLVLRPMIGEPIISVIMVTIGLSSLLKAIVFTIWGNLPKAFPSFIPRVARAHGFLDGFRVDFELHLESHRLRFPIALSLFFSP